jgi:hypothetical protein
MPSEDDSKNPEVGKIAIDIDDTNIESIIEPNTESSQKLGVDFFPILLQAQDAAREREAAAAKKVTEKNSAKTLTSGEECKEKFKSGSPEIDKEPNCNGWRYKVGDSMKYCHNPIWKNGRCRQKALISRPKPDRHERWDRAEPKLDRAESQSGGEENQKTQ